MLLCKLALFQTVSILINVISASGVGGGSRLGKWVEGVIMHVGTFEHIIYLYYIRLYVSGIIQHNLSLVEFIIIEHISSVSLSFSVTVSPRSIERVSEVK